MSYLILALTEKVLAKPDLLFLFFTGRLGIHYIEQVPTFIPRSSDL